MGGNIKRRVSLFALSSQLHIRRHTNSIGRIDGTSTCPTRHTAAMVLNVECPGYTQQYLLRPHHLLHLPPFCVAATQESFVRRGASSFRAVSASATSLGSGESIGRPWYMRQYLFALIIFQVFLHFVWLRHRGHLCAGSIPL